MECLAPPSLVEQFQKKMNKSTIEIDDNTSMMIT